MYIHPLSDVHGSVQIKEGTRIWQFSVILEKATLGSNCNICAHTLIEGDVIIGDNVTIKSGVFLWNGLRIADNVFIGPNATFTNDMFPRSKIYPSSFPNTYINESATIGANATILPGIIIGKGAMVGAGAVVNKDVPDFAVVVGNPAKILRYTSDIS